MKKIILIVILMLTLTTPAFAEDAVPYSGTVTITINAPVDFKDTLKFNIFTMDFKDIVENDPRILSKQFEMGADTGYSITIENLKGGKWTVLPSWKDLKSEKAWTIEKFAYEFEVKEGQNNWELNITRAEQKKQEAQATPFHMIIWNLIASTWFNSGPVIICLILVCIWYAWYKYKTFDRYDK